MVVAPITEHRKEENYEYRRQKQRDERASSHHAFIVPMTGIGPFVKPQNVSIMTSGSGLNQSRRSRAHAYAVCTSPRKSTNQQANDVVNSKARHGFVATFLHRRLGCSFPQLTNPNL